MNAYRSLNVRLPSNGIRSPGVPFIYLFMLGKQLLLLNVNAGVSFDLIQLREGLFLVAIDLGQEDVLGQLTHLVQVTCNLVVFFHELLTLSAPC